MSGLDTRTMEFSARPFPKKWKGPNYYSIGEIKDGKGYLVCLQGLLGSNNNPRLEEWSINADKSMLELDLEKTVPMSQLAIPANVSCQVYSVINGLALLTYSSGPQFVVTCTRRHCWPHFQTKFLDMVTYTSCQGHILSVQDPHLLSKITT